MLYITEKTKGLAYFEPQKARIMDENMFTSPAQKWEKWETKLVLYSLLTGLAGLLILAWILHV